MSSAAKHKGKSNNTNVAALSLAVLAVLILALSIGTKVVNTINNVSEDNQRQPFGLNEPSCIGLTETECYLEWNSYFMETERE